MGAITILEKLICNLKMVIGASAVHIDDQDLQLDPFLAETKNGKSKMQMRYIIVID